MDNIDDKLNKSAEKHKKILEKMTINFGAYKVNNNDYYLVVYKRKKINGLAIISPQSTTNINECLEALKWLTRYNQFRNIALVHAGFKTNVNFDSFYTVQNFLEKVLQNVSLSTNEKMIFEEGNQALQTIINLQQQLITAYKTFLEREQKVELGEINIITKKHINEVLNFINTFDYIQFTQLTTQYNQISAFKEINKLAYKNADIQPFMDSAVKTYLEEFVISKANLRKNINKVTHVPHIEQLSKEEHIEIARKVTLQNIDKIAEANKKKLRHPKL